MTVLLEGRSEEKVCMTIPITFLIILISLSGSRLLVLMMKMKLHSAYYHKADERGCAERYESLIRLYNSTDLCVLEMA